MTLTKPLNYGQQGSKNLEIVVKSIYTKSENLSVGWGLCFKCQL